MAPIGALLSWRGRQVPAAHIASCLCAELARAGFETEARHSGSLPKKLEYAAKKNIARMVVIGEKDARSGKVMIRRIKQPQASNIKQPVTQHIKRDVKRDVQVEVEQEIKQEVQVQVKHGIEQDVKAALLRKTEWENQAATKPEQYTVDISDLVDRMRELAVASKIC